MLVIDCGCSLAANLLICLTLSDIYNNIGVLCLLLCDICPLLKIIEGAFDILYVSC